MKFATLFFVYTYNFNYNVGLLGVHFILVCYLLNLWINFELYYFVIDIQDIDIFVTLYGNH